MSALSAKRQAFVANYLLDFNATQAAIRAGYSPRAAKVTGHRLLTDANVMTALAAGKRKASRANENHASFRRAGACWNGKPPPATSRNPNTARIRAIELLGKHSRQC